MLRWLVALLLLTAAAGGVLYVVAGRTPPPDITIHEPPPVVGQNGRLRLSVAGPQPDTLTVTLNQNGKTTPLFSLDKPGDAVTTMGEEGHGFGVDQPFGKVAVPQLEQGTAQIVAEATRKSFWGLRTISSAATKDIRVRLEPPRVSVLSTHHYINQGGSELVVYRVTPPDVVSGVRVG